MFLIMGITLYTSRIVLEQLGVSDFGVYNLVAGIVAMMGFMNAAMSSATQRYLAFDIGKNDPINLRKTFNTSLIIHGGIAVLIVLLAETIGLWYINYKMVLPLDRIYAANVVFQVSIFTLLVGVIQVPFNALIIAKERMNIYAYLSIVEAILKLAVVFLLVYFSTDKLITYSFLLFIVTLLIALFYQIYCKRSFSESRFMIPKDGDFYKELISYSGWNLFGNIAGVAKGQGVNLVLNLFFGTVINAAYAITNQVSSAINMFVVNLQMAFNPQIIKNYSQGNLQQMQSLIFQASKISFMLMLLLAMPILLNTDYILTLWLKDVPDDTIVFVQLALIGVLIESLSGPLMTAAQATGRIKWYQITIGTLIFLNLPTSYVLLKIGLAAPMTFIVSIVISVLSLIFRLFFLKEILNFDVKKYCILVLFRIILISTFACFFYFIHAEYITKNTNFIAFIIDSSLIIGTLSIVYLLLGFNNKEREFLVAFIKHKFNGKY
ncbi:oligosaccharide flippase family protein [Sphingobacterium rhinopitheci]|nr:oligosaccharide flippase family protein [Sphingobacterium rhinopitheci]